MDIKFWEPFSENGGKKTSSSRLYILSSGDVVDPQILHILLKLPRVTKNKIDSSGIEVTVKELTENENARVKELSTSVPHHHTYHMSNF